MITVGDGQKLPLGQGEQDAVGKPVARTMPLGQGTPPAVPVPTGQYHPLGNDVGHRALTPWVQ